MRSAPAVVSLIIQRTRDRVGVRGMDAHLRQHRDQSASIGAPRRRRQMPQTAGASTALANDRETHSETCARLHDDI